MSSTEEKADLKAGHPPAGLSAEVKSCWWHLMDKC